MKRLLCTFLSAVLALEAFFGVPAMAFAEDYQRVEGLFCYGYAQDVLRLVNEERGKCGLKSLVMLEELTDAAMMRAAEISVSFSHTRPNGSSCMTAFAYNFTGGENIAMGYVSPEDVMDGWMNSPGHRGNILTAGFTKIGIGCFDDGGYLHWVQVFSDILGDTEKSTDNRDVAVDVSLASGKSTIVHDGGARNYTIRFEANGGTGTMAAQTMARNVYHSLRANAFRRSGHVFIGWAKTKTGKVAFANKARVRNLAPRGGKTVLYAVWAKKAYKVKFYANGGKGKMAVQKMTYGKSKKLSANKFKRKGYVFKGWAKSKALAKKGKVAYKNKKSVKNLVKNGTTVKLFAVWEKK